MQLFYGTKGTSAVTGIGIGFDSMPTGAGLLTAPLHDGDLGYLMVVTNTTTALPTPAGWALVGSGTLASGGKWAIYRRSLLASDVYATTFSTVQVVSGASGIWAATLAVFRANRGGTLNIESETINSNVASTAVAVPGFTSVNPTPVTIALTFIDFEQSQDTIIPSRNEYVDRRDAAGTVSLGLPIPYYLLGDPISKGADSWRATASVASIVATISVSETGTTATLKSTVESKSSKAVIAPIGNANINTKSTVESKPLKGTASDVDRLSGSQTYGGGVQIF